MSEDTAVLPPPDLSWTLLRYNGPALEAPWVKFSLHTGVGTAPVNHCIDEMLQDILRGKTEPGKGYTLDGTWTITWNGNHAELTDVRASLEADICGIDILVAVFVPGYRGSATMREIINPAV